jgi:hypothetical protein
MDLLQNVVIQYPPNITEEEVNILLDIDKSLGRLNGIVDLTIYDLYELEKHFNLTIKMGWYNSFTELSLTRKD